MKFDKSKMKELLRIYGIFSGILIFMLGIIIGAVKISERRRENKLRAAVVKVFSENTEDERQIGKFIKIKSPASLNAALYEINDLRSASKDYALILRVQTLYGPVPAVFLYNKDGGAKLIGFAAISGRIKRLLQDDSSNPRISYWEKRIPGIVNDTLKDTE